MPLNILVSVFTSVRFVKAGLFRWRVLWPFALGAIPFAFLGGSIQLPGAYYRPLVGAVLLCSAARLLWPRELKSTVDPRDPPIWAGILCGIGIGFLSGLTGTGRRHLPFAASPVPRLVRYGLGIRRCRRVHPLQLNRWHTWRRAIMRALPSYLWVYAVAVGFGAVVGTTFRHPLPTADHPEGAWRGSRHRGPEVDRRLLRLRGRGDAQALAVTVRRWRLSAIGRRVLLRGATLCRDRATAPIEDIWW